MLTVHRGASTVGDSGVPEALQRQSSLKLPEVSELNVVRHYTRLSRQNFSIDGEFYPLGSCTMKYNPKAANQLAMLAGFLGHHPSADASLSQGTLACLYDLQEILKEASGMHAVSLTPAAGAQGEFAGVAMIQAWHRSRGDDARTEMIIPDAAHGTNPASAVMCGMTVREIPTAKNGDIDIEALKLALGPKTAGIMLTNPSTLGVFERQIETIAQLVHQAGGLLYYDGANLNAILGKTTPSIMGFDVVHINVHKTFSTPHGGGGPGGGPVGVSKRLEPFLPVPIVGFDGERYAWLQEAERPQSIGRLSAFAGNIGVLLRAYVYAKMLGSQGMERVAEYAVLNANYLKAKLEAAGFQAAYPNRLATHEFCLTVKPEHEAFNTSAMDIAKRLLDFGYHAPTTYFPLLVPECLLIEPTETEDKATLDGFVAAMAQIREEMASNPENLKQAPLELALSRLDDVKAARELDLVYVQE
jgi:glycine dehydrogenase subunit 2